ncbi:MULTISPECIES: SgcJ/EcaC family oxidoreductase [Mycobacterium avium complex (MAC)]|uniref:SgcJ/EcaC family oxidoreductase n=1 Tax=Mycobacterium intracellulare subsp. chimaera TaxID=222805 RepID=A0ABT7PAJ9_MYCIT|nr:MULTISPECIES: SgcJ/EcaC family oxidoreductase [Mycobacterium avium complex (MAC)]AOS94722.1 hypothetical protein AN480_26860 [Mycobacterium intracellulare subsp. chimaera]MDM3930321.1 SgcJ/EcaC family oxidoreductase [Mycobacterium intracellulare subsp. chimaera]PBA69176.1 DUF4440 domain-containing protein [Mycobacterium avium]
MTDQRHTTAAADEAAIRDLIARQINSWNAGGGAAYAHTYTPDGDCVSFLGGHHQGRYAIAASGEAPSAGTLFAKLLRRTQLDVEITHLRFLTSDVAVIHANGGLAKPGRRPSRRTRRTNTSVAVRTGDGWLLAATHNTTQRPLAQKLLTAATGRAR